MFFPAGLTISPVSMRKNSATKRRFRNLMEVSGLLDQLTTLKAVPAAEAISPAFTQATISNP